MRPDRPSSAEKTHPPFVCTVSPTIDRNCRPRSAKAVPHGGGNEPFPASRLREKLNICNMLGYAFTVQNAATVANMPHCRKSTWSAEQLPPSKTE
jgi:hypothetical protein